jgi:branched-chain amino acid transport system ATP-binding protein
MPLLSVSGLKVSYGAVAAVRGIDFNAGQGEIIALLGANGAGKSSTMNALVGLGPKAAGSVNFDGADITNAAPEQLVRHGMTLVPEGRRVFAALSVQENLRMGAYSVTDPAKVAQSLKRVYDLFPILKERARQFAGTLSGGQQQMLAVGRALMSRPKLLLLDEPSLGLAPLIVEQIFSLIARLRDEGMTILLVEQNVAMSLEIADRAYVLSAGRVAASGTVAELRSSGAIENAYLGAV